MKRLLTTILVAFAILSPTLCIASQASAANVFQVCSSNSAADTDICKSAHSNGNPIVKIIKAAIDVISFIVGIGAVIGIVVSGFRLITSGGNSEAVASARSGLIYSLVAIAIVAFAQAIVALVLDKLIS